MSSSTNTTNLSCARCHLPQANLSEPLKRCGKCRTVQYCSRECQKLDWSNHKKQCREGGLDASAGVRTRETMRISLADLRRHADGNGVAEPSSDTIYYLQTSTPHLHDISVSGPYYPLESIIPQVLNNFGDECTQGRQTFQEFVGEHGPGLASFQHLTSPINKDPNRTRTVKLIREKNPNLAAKLPGPAWYILETEMDFNSRRAGAARAGNGPVPVKSMMVHKTFDNLEAANVEAKVLAAKEASNGPNGRVFEIPESSEDGGYCAGVMTRAGNSQKVVNIQVRYDSGRTISPV